MARKAARTDFKKIINSAPKQKAKKTVDSFTRSQMGSEPEGMVVGMSGLIRAYSWYSTQYDRSACKQWLLEYTRKHFPKKVKTVEALDESSLEVAMGWISRMLIRGVSLPDGLDTRVADYVNGLTSKVVKQIVKREATDKIDQYLPDFESAVDTLAKEFDAYNYLTSNSVPQSYARRIAEYYAAVVEELNIAYDKGDSQVVEAYSHLKRSDLLITRRYYESIVSDCERFLGNVKKERAPRKAKAKKPEQILRHFKYMANHDQLKLTSSNPANIIGASQVYCLNTSNNILTVFFAKEGGLNVHRSSIINYDEDKSGAKRSGRKLKTVIDHILNGNKKQREGVLTSLESAFVPFSDRINTNVVILKVVK